MQVREAHRHQHLRRPHRHRKPAVLQVVARLQAAIFLVEHLRVHLQAVVPQYRPRADPQVETNRLQLKPHNNQAVEHQPVVAPRNHRREISRALPVLPLSFQARAHRRKQAGSKCRRRKQAILAHLAALPVVLRQEPKQVSQVLVVVVATSPAHHLVVNCQTKAQEPEPAQPLAVRRQVLHRPQINPLQEQGPANQDRAAARCRTNQHRPPVPPQEQVHHKRLQAPALIQDSRPRAPERVLLNPVPALARTQDHRLVHRHQLQPQARTQHNQLPVLAQTHNQVLAPRHNLVLAPRRNPVLAPLV